MTKKRGFFIVLYFVFLFFQIVFSFKEIGLFSTMVSTDLSIITGLLYLAIVYGITFWIFIYLLHKITYASYAVVAGFVLLSIFITLILDPYVYDQENFPVLFQFFHDEFQVYVFLLYTSVLSLFIFPMYLIGLERIKRKKAIEKATRAH